MSNSLQAFLLGSSVVHKQHEEYWGALSQYLQKGFVLV